MILEGELAKSQRELNAPAIKDIGVDVKDDQNDALDVVDCDCLGV